MAYDFETRNMPRGIKANFNESKSRIEALEALSTLLSSDIIDDVVTGGSDKVLSAEQGKYLKGLIDAINLIIQSDDINLDEVQELVDYIKTTRSTLDSILINNLTSTDITKALTAAQGKVLKDLIDGLDTDDVAEGSNLYYTQAKFDSALGAKSTSDLSEGTNLYYTDARAKTAAVVNSTAGSETDQASSVSSMKNYVSGLVSGNRKYVFKTGNASIIEAEEKVFFKVTVASNATLPSVDDTNDGQAHLIGNRQASSANVTVGASDSDTVDGASNLVLAPGEYVEFIYDNSATNWFIKE